MAEKTALVLITNGSEEMEAVISIDVLRRAGVKALVAVVDVPGGIVTCARDVKLAGDVTFQEALTAGPYDAVVLPGGLPGAKAFAANEGVKKLLKEQYDAGRIVAAICASPAFVLPAAGIAEGKKATCYPSLESNFGGKYTYVPDQKVVIDGNLITSQGPGTAFDFALELSGMLVGEDKSKDVRKALLL